MIGVDRPVVVPRAIIFDWDNTLVDSWATIHDALNLTFAAEGQPLWSFDETKERVRKSLRDTFPAMFGARWKEVQALYLGHFEAIHLQRLAPFPGAAELLAALHNDGFYLAIVSNKTGRLLRNEVSALGWEGWFSSIVGAGDALRDKPDPAPVALALDGAAIDAGDVWFVGDTDIDMICAENTGCVPVLLGEDAAAAVRAILRFNDCSDLATALLSSSHLQYNAPLNR